MRDDDDPVAFAKSATPIMEVTNVKTEKIIGMIGTYVAIGAASAAGTALWNKVLEEKVADFTDKMKRPKNEKLINFKKAKRRLSR